MKGSARSKAEAGMMQRAAHRLPVAQPVGKRGAIMGACSGDSKELVLDARKEHWLLVDAASKEASLRNVCNRQAA
jgi:hypothetical protein